MRRNVKSAVAKAVVVALTITLAGIASPETEAAAAKKPKLSKTKVTVKVKKSAKVKIKNVKAKKIKKLAVTSNKKKNATVKKNGKTAFTITGKKAGSAVVTAKITIKGKSKPVSLKVKVTVKAADSAKDTGKETAAPVTAAPTQTSSVASPAAPVGSSDTTTNPPPTVSPYVKKTLNTNINVTVDDPTDPETMKETNPRLESSETVFTDDFEDSTIKEVPIGEEGIQYVVDGVLTDRQCGEVLSIVDEGHEGGKCLKVSNRDRSFDGVRIDLENVGDIISKGGTYNFTAYVRYASDSTSNDQLVFSQEIQTLEESEKVYSNFETKAAPKQWTQISGRFSVPDSFYHYAIYLENPYSTETREFPDIYVDDVKIECVDKAVPVDNLTSIYDTYKDMFPFIGTSCSYADILGQECVDFMKSQYNCVTPGNEMKPDAVLGTKATLLTLDEVKNNPDYVIPAGYAEDADNMKDGTAVVPQLDFNGIDTILKEAKKAGLKIRAHTLLWHEQTPVYFFQKSFKTNKNNPKNNYNVSAETMNKRIEFYIRSVMTHVLSSENADVIYAWDVVNEYFHSHEADQRDDPTYYEKIYGSYTGTKSSSNPNGTQSGMTTEPAYVKLAFKIAREELVEHNHTEIKLFYNDFNTYDVSEDICHLVNYLNCDEKLCDGVGMQSHLDLSYPSVLNYKKALEMFHVNIPETEIQITELDATMNYGRDTATGKMGFLDKGETDKKQAAYYYDIMKAIIQEKQAGANVTGIIFWSLYDNVSWRSLGQPCIFNGLNSPKSAYYAVIDVINDMKDKATN
ncbi:MAG: endo-1,4-beta-xylanase [Roseburia sp.]|nr:endo-1,4-beta-xylanase [Roseburia sp.]